MTATALPDLYGVLPAERGACARTDGGKTIPIIHRTKKNKIN
jgi:hypothetical protein